MARVETPSGSHHEAAHKGNSLRSRVSRSEVDRLLETGRVEETVHFGLDQDARITYALEHTRSQQNITVLHRAQEVAIVLHSESVRQWAHSSAQVGVYGRLDVWNGELMLLVEKDFACLDRLNADNEDALPNPNMGIVC